MELESLKNLFIGQTLQEEGQTDEKLIRLAGGQINMKTQERGRI